MVRLKELRLESGLEVKDMCRKLDVSDSRYRKWESGTNGVPLDYALMCCDIFHCTLDELSGHRTLTFSVEERKLIDLYRKCDTQGQQYLMQMAEVTAGLFGGA